ncbi:MAG TPA: hypothetical protein DIW54_13285 [Chitinophagaceae bacterium]|nr:hypothetical protein [Chitinophagaceae bacterium]HCT24237.1 hypothetical protein [Chitinophagaceae bacterium]
MKYIFTLLCVALLSGTSCKQIRSVKKLGETTCNTAKVCMDKAKTIREQAAIQLQTIQLESGGQETTMVPDDAIPTRLMIW